MPGATPASLGGEEATVTHGGMSNQGKLARMARPDWFVPLYRRDPDLRFGPLKQSAGTRAAASAGELRVAGVRHRIDDCLR